MMEPRNGRCCSCGYDGDEEGTCGKRADETHCVHWWEGTDAAAEIDANMSDSMEGPQEDR
jgi:hypothetical protein